MSDRYIEALAFLTDPSRVKIYTNEERGARPNDPRDCPVCHARPGAPCRGEGGHKLARPHPDRRVMRSSEETDRIIEALARRYARAYDPMESYGPRKYPTPKWAKEN